MKHINMPSYAIEYKVPICPLCKNAKYTTISSTIKICNPSIYTAECSNCDISWDMRLCGSFPRGTT